MANKFLKPIFQKVFDRPFSYRTFEDRLMMQKMVYLLQEAGVNIGHYGFDWYKHGPYSQALLDDMYMEDKMESIELNYTVEAEERIKKLKEIFDDTDAGQAYGIKNWTECLASIHFLRKKELGSDVSEEVVLQTLRYRKPHLNNDSLNRKAYKAIDEFVA